MASLHTAAPTRGFHRIPALGFSLIAIFLVSQFGFIFGIASASSGSPAASSGSSCSPRLKQGTGSLGWQGLSRDLSRLRGGGKDGNRVLVLDVDNCLYSEAESGIECQIVEGIHMFCARQFSLSPGECDRLHKDYGSTIAGLKMEHGISREDEAKFYAEVYSMIDYTSLLGSAGGDATGYHHETRLLDLVSRVKAPVYLASNSPSSHVYKVLAALGMTTFGWAGIITPDTSGFLTKGDALFWSGLLAIYPKEGGHSIWLADDSRANLKVAASVGIRGLPVGGEGGAATVQNAVCTFMGLIPSPTDWSFDPIKYIQSKNVVDRVSLCSAVKHALKTALESLPISNKRPMRIVDVGAGLLNMLEEAQSIASELEVGLEYQALETEEALFDENLRRLSELGFQSLPQEEDGFTRMRNDGEGVTVVLRKQDFRKVARGEFKDADVFIMCCFSDLMEPDALVKSVLKASAGGKGALVYSPITFCGRTSLDPSQPAQGSIPSDVEVFEAYHKGLVEDQGHNLDVKSLLNSIAAHGGRLMAQGPSDWAIPGPGYLWCDKGNDDDSDKEVDFEQSRNINPEIYEEQWRLWNTMVYFFATGTAARAPPQWDMQGWIERVKRAGPMIDVGNTDILWGTVSSPRPPALLLAASSKVTEEGPGLQKKSRFLEFYAKNKVRVNETLIPEARPGELVLETVRSAVSSGTELKVFTGDFDTGAQLDTTFQEMKDSSMAYPLQYGYSLVGRVVSVGEGVARSEWLGRLVFAFAPHGSHTVVSAHSAIAVPPGVSPEDACYFPAVETALSLVQEANPVIGERVSVIGQGLIGLLVTAILAGSHGSQSVYAVEMNPQRASVARRMGAGTVLHPMALSEEAREGKTAEEKFDVSIEVSGNWRALQSAIDNTGEFGRVIIGSWYGGKDAAALKLGIDFHRSHITLKSSQVSKIPAHLSGRWDKDRRFNEAWKWVKRIRPSMSLGTSIVPISEAQSAYEALLEGKTVAVEFTYD